jgi:hypothetical protein
MAGLIQRLQVKALNVCGSESLTYKSTNNEKNSRGAPDSDFYYRAGYWISEKNPAGYRIFYHFESLTFNI